MDALRAGFPLDDSFNHYSHTDLCEVSLKGLSRPYVERAGAS